MLDYKKDLPILLINKLMVPSVSMIPYHELITVITVLITIYEDFFLAVLLISANVFILF